LQNNYIKPDIEAVPEFQERLFFLRGVERLEDLNVDRLESYELKAISYEAGCEVI